MHRYFGTAFMYSGVRKMVYTWDSKYRDIDYKDHKKIISERPILYVDRCMHFVFGGLLGMVNFPIYLFNDIRNIEMYADRKSTRLNSSHMSESRMPSSA